MARRPIASGEEITADYALWLDFEHYVMRHPCGCGALLCRKQVTGRDWRLPELQDRYRGHFTPFLQRRIASLEQG